MIYLSLLVVLLNMSAYRGSKVIISLFALHLGTGGMMIGLIVAMYSLCPMFLAIYAGKLVDRLGVRWPLALGCIGVTGALVLPGLWPSLTNLYISALFLGAAHVFYNVSIQNLIGMLSTPDTRTNNFSNFSLCMACGGFIGPLIAGFTIDHFSYETAYLCIAVFPAISASIMIYSRRRLSAMRNQRVPTDDEQQGYSVGLLANVPLRRTLITSGIILTAIDLFQFYMPIYGKSIGLSASAIGMVLAMFATASFTVRLIMPKLTSRFGEEKILIGSIFVAAATYAVFPLVQSGLVLGLIAFMLGMGTGCGQPLTLMMIYARAPTGRSGEALGLRMTINNLTHILVPVLFGSLSSIVGLAPVFLTNSVLLGAAGFLTKKR